MPIIALISAVLYTIGCYVWGGHFPFYKFELYAGAGVRDKAAVPIFFADDKESNIWEYQDFHGIDPEQFLAHGMPTSITWMVEEAAQWVRSHPLTDRPQGPHKVAFGFRVLQLQESGDILEEIVILERGSAWKRS